MIEKALSLYLHNNSTIKANYTVVIDKIIKYNSSFIKKVEYIVYITISYKSPKISTKGILANMTFNCLNNEEKNLDSVFLSKLFDYIKSDNCIEILTNTVYKISTYTKDYTDEID